MEWENADRIMWGSRGGREKREVLGLEYQRIWWCHSLRSETHSEGQEKIQFEIVQIKSLSVNLHWFHGVQIWVFYGLMILNSRFWVSGCCSESKAPARGPCQWRELFGVLTGLYDPLISKSWEIVPCYLLTIPCYTF